MYPSRPQWQSNYQQYGAKGGKGGGKVNLFEAPNQLSMIQQFLAAPGSTTATTGPWQDDGGWSAGNFYSLVTKKKAAKCNTMVSKAAGPVAMSNRFKVLAGNEYVEEGSRAPTRTINIIEFAKPAVRQGIIKHSKRYRGIAKKNKKSVGFSDKLTEDIWCPGRIRCPG